jgi:hypothetical protein
MSEQSTSCTWCGGDLSDGEDHGEGICGGWLYVVKDDCLHLGVSMIYAAPGARWVCDGCGTQFHPASMSCFMQRAQIASAIKHLQGIRDDTTCPMNIAADIDQVLVEVLKVQEEQ